MDTVVHRPIERWNTSWLNHPVNEALSDYLDGRAYPAPRSASLFADDDADALPSMFRRPRAAEPASKPRTISRTGGFPPYVIILFLLAVAPLQAALLKHRFTANEEGAIERVLVVAKRSAAELLSVPSAEASQSQSLPPASAASFDGRGWSEVVESFKLLLAEQTASEMKQAGLLRRLEAWMNARANVAGACAVPSLDCRKSATFVR